ncbi:Putative thiosulfate sulfurtransferase, mitochondrial [Psilocybe cubensis]|uniref:Rhodanese domain-containing protein n=2 Tax=Psilocybe cubensis TaxID=181762 RepID=A0A8H7YAZ4_PSICU|nr:Putative thiosulfate sulfurtransferase, mitochondrial [Psilocybe cubensis]KAH9487150.1 Putative thiosulfate sulfurtransferase, mitochondrial [Psilocybe cubensis]
MFQRSIIRTLRTASRANLASVTAVRPAVALSVRFNSTQPPSSTKAFKTPEEQERRQQLDLQDKMEKDWDAKVITYEDFLPKTENPSADAYIIDVREPDEVIQGMIPSAVNLPLSVLPEALHMDREAFFNKFRFEKPRPTQEVTFYCRSGKRSSTASDIAKRNGFTNILNYKGSWLEWVEKQNPKPSS